MFDTTKNSCNNMDMEIIAEICTSWFYWKKLHSNYTKIPCFVEMKSKQQNKFCGLSKNKYAVFYYKVPMVICTSSKLCVYDSFSPNLPFLGSPKSHHHDSKTNKNSKFKPIMFHEQSLS